MDRPSALSRLSDITADLAPTGRATAADLQAARTALAASLLQHGEQPAIGPFSLVPPGAAADTASSSVLSAIVDRAAATAGAQTPLALQRSIPGPTLGNPSLTAAATGGMSARTLGPFVDKFGTLRWIDLFSPTVQTAITRTPATAPALLLPLSLRSGPIPTDLPVGAGSLWISAPLLAAGAPAAGYAGLRISGGTIKFSAAPTAGSGGLQIAAGVTVTLTVKPDGGTPGPAGGNSPGADGGDVVADVPASVTFTFTSAGATVSAAGNASLRAYGTTVALQHLPQPAAWSPLIGQVLIPYGAQPANFAISSVASSLFTPSGSAPIQSAAWALAVASAAPAQLGAAASGGSLGLLLGQGLAAKWTGLAAGPFGLGVTWLMGANGVLALQGLVANPRQSTATITLWPEARATPPRRSTIDLTVAQGGGIYFTSVAAFAGTTHTELIAVGATLAAHIDRPLAADGRRLGPTLPGIEIIYRTAAMSGVIIGGQAPPTQPPPPPIALALRNALLVTTPPAGLLVSGQFSASPMELTRGVMILGFGLDLLLPTLPDPYAANFLPLTKRGIAGVPSAAAASSALLALVQWNAATPTLSFLDATLSIGGLGLTLLPATPTPAAAGAAAPGLAASAVSIQAEDAQRVAALQQSFNSALSSAAPPLRLLDVSTNVDQFGVGLPVPGRVDVAGAAGGQAMLVAGLDLVAPCLELRVFTLPSVQWEPVQTQPNPKVTPFPSPVGFLDDGGPTLLGARDVTLVPAEPAKLLDQVLAAYNGGEAAAALLTLPFGMTAVVNLPARTKGGPPILHFRPGLTEVQPNFTSQDLAGGRQVSLTAAREILAIGARSPSLPGATVQLRNVVDGSRTLQNLSVLGPAVDQIFNADFNVGGHEPLVPVERIDLSGYGASTFSAWTDPAAAPPAVVQVRFNQMVGRASHEVVQVKSILYPWGAIVVRTITIDRQDDGEVIRYDSGWVAATDGTFNIGGITVHPGAVTAARNIRQIRDTTQTYTNTGGTVSLTAVQFDADIEIAGVVSGGRGGLVPSQGQLGYVQETPVGAPLTPADLAALIDARGALGGPVDCVVTVAGTAQTMRLSRVEVANAPHGGSPEFAAAARGSLTLPPAGSWSVLSRIDGLSEPTPVDPDLGLALIRQGAAGGAASTAPWRLAEPLDLWTPDAPSMDYCLLHATDSTRVLFPRPKVESGATAFTSTVAPLLADGFALMAATGICPRQDTCLVFPNANHSLAISGPGALTLNVSPNPFPPSMPSRVLAGGAAATVGFEYADENAHPASVAIAITPNSWSVGLKGVNVRLDMAPFNGLMRTVGDALAASDSPVAFANARLVLGSVLKPLQDIMTFLEDLGLPDPLSMAFSNGGWTKSKKYKLKAGLQFNLPMTVPIVIPTSTPLGSLTIGLKLGFGNAAASEDALFSSSAQWLAYLSFKGAIQVPVFPPLPVQAGGLVIFKMEADFPAGKNAEQEKLTLQLGVIITVGGDLIPGVLKLQASVAFAFTLVVVTSPPPSIGVGVGLILSASGQILGGLIGITFTAEADGLLIFQLSPKETLVQATFDVQVDVSICWFLDITFEVQTQYTKQIS